MKKLSTQQGYQRGQEYHANWYCPTCHTFISAHEKGCTDRRIQISATARIPRKNVNKKVWDAFYKKFVLKEDVKYIRDQKKMVDDKNHKLQYDKFSKRKDDENHIKAFRLRMGLDT